MKKKKDIREIMYKLYESYEESLEEEEPFEEFRGEEEPIIGGVYIGNLDKRRIMFIIIDKVTDNYYEAFKISQYWELGTIRDIIYRNELGTFIIQTDLNFYLTKDEIKRFKKIDVINNVEKIKEYSEMDIKEKLEYKELEKGLHFPFGNRWVDKFKEKELEAIEPYHLRILDIEEE